MWLADMFPIAGTLWKATKATRLASLAIRFKCRRALTFASLILNWGLTKERPPKNAFAKTPKNSSLHSRQFAMLTALPLRALEPGRATVHPSLHDRRVGGSARRKQRKKSNPGFTSTRRALETSSRAAHKSATEGLEFLKWFLDELDCALLHVC